MDCNHVDVAFRLFLDIDDVASSGDFRAWRYVMEGGYSAQGTLDVDCFKLRDTDDGYLSFYHSNRTPNEDLKAKIAHIHNLIKVRKTKPAIYFSLDVEELLDFDEVKFFDAGYPHVGMSHNDYPNLSPSYTTDRDRIMEHATILIEYSSLYERRQGGEVRALTS